MLGGNLTIVLLFLLNAVFRGAGDAAIAMRVLLLGNALNIVLGPVLHLRPRSVSGARRRRRRDRRPTSAAAPRVLYQLYAAGTAARAGCGSGARSPSGSRRSCAPCCGCPGSGTIQILIGTASYVGLVRIISIFGSAALAGYTIGIRIIIFALLPAFGVSNAAATMVGQNLGAGRPIAPRTPSGRAMRYNMMFLGGDRRPSSCSAPRWITAFFTTDPLVQPYAAQLPADRQPADSCSTRPGWC